jgi:hypothetical protein
MSTITTVAGHLLALGWLDISAEWHKCHECNGALISAANQRLLLLLHRIKLLSLPLPLQGRKFIGLSKLYRDREAQMFRLLSKKIAASKSHCGSSQADYRSCQRFCYRESQSQNSA